MKITNRDLQLIFDAAKDYLLNSTKRPELDDQTYRSECWVQAVADKLGVKVEFEKRINVEPVE